MVAFWLYLLVCSLALLNTQLVFAIKNVSPTILERAVARGAVCLDGSPPAYYYQKGFGNGINNWIVNIEGGGWCTSTQDCLDRSKGYYGSSRRQIRNQNFSGILDDDIAFNPDFYNWQKILIHYCDGSSFMSYVEKVDYRNNLTFRGARIFNVMMEEMLAKGMVNAHKAILVGTSAGGLTTILHCDKFRKLLPNISRVKCVSDSGFFIHGIGHPGVDVREKILAGVIATHKLANDALPKTCTSKMNPNLCLFPENLVEDIQTPLFILESAFDSAQITTTLIPAGGGHEWDTCMRNLTLCNATQMAIMKDFRRVFIETLMKLDKSSTRGMFVHSCFRHGHIYLRDGWTCSIVAGNVLANKTIGQAVGDWYFDRSHFHEIYTKNDLPWNCTSPLSEQSFNKVCQSRLHHI